jgi:hypothetical protein
LLADTTGSARQPPQPPNDPRPTALNLAEHDSELPGQWLLTLPLGAKYQVVLRPLNGKRFRLEKAVCFSGGYEVRDNRLLLVAPLNQLDAGYAWEMRAPDELVLVANATKAGNNYVGAILKRQSAEVPPAPMPPPAPTPAPRPADSPVPLPAGPALKLADYLAQLPGQWLLTLPRGFKYETVLRPLPENRFSLEKAVSFSGVYEVRDNRLLIVPQNPVDAGYAWELRAPDELVLVGQPPISKIGSDYRGATLKRQSQAPGPIQPNQAPTLASGGDAQSPPSGRRVLLYLATGFFAALLVMSVVIGVWLSTRQRRVDEAPRKTRPR